MLKKLFRFLGISLLIIIGLIIITFLYLDESIPVGTEDDRAEQLADKMLTALNKPAFDSLSSISFTFKGMHRIHWDRENNSATVLWDENEVYLDLDIPPANYNLLEYQAYKYFINDSFWVVAPFKIRDAGVIRSVVDTAFGEGLLVTYTNGGVTPGDSYLWILDEKGFPISWKIWADILPVGGLEFTWEDWESYNDVWLASMHRNFIIDLDITNLIVN